MGINFEEFIVVVYSSCFSMVLLLVLIEVDFVVDDIIIKVIVSLDEVDDGFEVSYIVLDVSVKIKEILSEKFE